MMLEINDGHNKMKQKNMQNTECTQEDDLMDERRKIFGEEES